MPFIQRGELKLFQFELLMQPDIVQGIFTRRGGVSPHPWRSLNLGGTVGDTRTNVIENRRRIFDLMQRPVESIFDTWQVHSDRVVCVDQPRPLESQPIQADAILTNDPRITLFMRFADCVPIFFYDPVKRVIGIAHAGWVGTIKRIADNGKTLRLLPNRYPGWNWTFDRCRSLPGGAGCDRCHERRLWRAGKSTFDGKGWQDAPGSVGCQSPQSANSGRAKS